MTDRDRQEFTYDGTVESAKLLIGFIWNGDFDTLVPKECGDPRMGNQVINTNSEILTIKAGDVVQREDWGETNEDYNVPRFRFGIIRRRLQ
jgi:hypothetical protein